MLSALGVIFGGILMSACAHTHKSWGLKVPTKAASDARLKGSGLKVVLLD